MLFAMFFEYVDCYKRDGREEWAYIDISKQYIQRGEFENGLQYLSRAEQINPAEATVPFTRGLVISALGAEDKAIPHYAKAIAMSPSDATYPFHLGTVLFGYKKNQEALNMFEMALTRDPSLDTSTSNSVTSHTTLAQGRPPWPVLPVGSRMMSSHEPMSFEDDKETYGTVASAGDSISLVVVSM